MPEPIKLNTNGEIIQEEPKAESKEEKKAEETVKPENEAVKSAEKPKDEKPEDDQEDDDIVMEDEGDGPDAVKKLREKLKKAVKEKQEYLDGWQRAKAEFVNIRKRDQDANEQYLKFAKEDLVVQLVPVLDSFEMAFANKEAWEKVDKNWRTGVEHIYSQFLSILNQNNVQQVSPLGEKFDPARDEALEFEPVTEERFNHIITRVIQKGYKLNGKLIKAPKVKVGAYKKA